MGEGTKRCDKDKTKVYVKKFILFAEKKLFINITFQRILKALDHHYHPAI